MQLSWFPKPIYKIVYLIFFPALAGCVWTVLSGSAGGILFFIIAILSLSLLIGSSFIVCSGVYVTTVCKGNKQSGKIALTFDDGPCEKTMEILKILDKFDAKASFFLIGRETEIYKDIVNEIAQKGHTIGNHSYEHKSWFPIKGISGIKLELKNTQDSISSITGKKPIYFRPPFGITNPLIAKALRNSDLTTIGWSVRSLDTVKKDARDILNRVTNKIGPGSIVLMHDTSKNVLEVLEQLLIYCKQKNLEPVTLDELLEH